MKESFQKCKKLEEKQTYEEKRKCKVSTYKEVIDTVINDNNSTAVDRLYGARQSLRGWDNNTTCLLNGLNDV